jgi:hypothetical protein
MLNYSLSPPQKKVQEGTATGIGSLALDVWRRKRWRS